MSPALHPRIAAKLAAFAQRRRRLLVLRGSCLTVGLLVVAVLLVALVDGMFVLPDAVRWALSGTAYATALVAGFWFCVRPLFHAPDTRQLALLMEGTAPELREEILSAVELGQGNGEWDSPQFRALVQSSVSTRLAGVEVATLLPTRLLLRVLLGLGLVLLLCGAALLVPALSLPSRLARVLLPGANLERLSAVRVRIVEPSPPERVVPSGEMVSLLVELSGRRTGNAFLETFTRHGGRSLLPLQADSAGRFASGIQVGREEMEYRVRAGDAITRKYRLAARARPSVLHFRKKYLYPPYTGQEPRETSEESGELAAVEGTAIELAIQTDQPVREATLAMEVEGKKVELPLEKRADGWLGVRFPLDKSFNYRVKLVAAETGFENKFSPEYEARSIPDLIPEITLERPEKDLVASANEVVSLVGSAKDDVGLAAVEQHVRVNGGKWVARNLAKPVGKETRFAVPWDLFDQGARPGESISTKLVAIDRKGGRGESRTITVTIAAAGFERAREEAIAAHRELLDTISTWKASAEALEKSYRGELRPTFDEGGSEIARRKEALEHFTQAAEDCVGKGVAVQAQVAAALRLALPGHETANLALFSRMVARGQSALLALPPYLHSAGADPLPDYTRELIHEAEGVIGTLIKRTRPVEELCSRQLLVEELDLANENMQVIMREQATLAKLAQGIGTDQGRWAQTAARQKVVLAEIASTEELLSAASKNKNGGVGERLGKIHAKLGEQRAILVEELKSEPGRELLAPLAGLAKAVGEAWQGTLEIRRDYNGVAQSVTQQGNESVEPTWLGLDRLRHELEGVLLPEKYAPEVRVELGAGRWEARVNGWKSHGDVEELRPDADAGWVRDLRQLQFALESVREDLLVPGQNVTREAGWKRVATLNQAFRMLEPAHELAQLAAGWESFAAAERYHGGSLRLRTRNATDWMWLDQRLRAMDAEIARADLADKEWHAMADEARKLLRDIVSDPMVRVLAEEMPQRVRRDREPIPRPEEAERISEKLRGVLAGLRPLKEQARKSIMDSVPRLPERLEQLVKEAQELQAAAEKKASEPEKEQGQPSPDGREQLAQQQALNKKVETVRDVIRAEANEQDMMSPEGREKARDADDALALLREPPVKAEQAFAEAAKAERSSEKKAALQAAGQADEKLAQALGQLAEHYGATTPDKEAQTRVALRAAERELGVKEQLDKEYAKAEELAKAAQESPQGMLAKLEKALGQNPLMRQELSNVSRELVDQAGEKLARASKAESAVARDLEKVAASLPKLPPPEKPQANSGTSSSLPENPAPQPGSEAPGKADEPSAPSGEGMPSPASPTPHPMLASAGQKQKVIGQDAAQAASAVERAGRHEARLQNKVAGEQLQKLGAEVKTTAEVEIPVAADALGKAQHPSEVLQPVGKAEQKLQNQASRLAETKMQPQVEPAGQATAPASRGDERSTMQSTPAPAQPSAEAKSGAAGVGSPTMVPTPAPGSPANPTTQPPPPAPAATPAPAGGPQESATEGASPTTVMEQAAMLASATPPEAGSDLSPRPPAPPQQQVWMARALDSLDAALHENPGAGAESKPPQGTKEGKAGQKPGTQNQPQDGQKPGNAADSKAMQQAQKAMAAASQAQAAEMRAGRSQTPPGLPSTDDPKGTMMAKSDTGAQAAGSGKKAGALPGLPGGVPDGSWGKLPKKMAEQLTQGQRENVSTEYQKEVETYYRVIAERARSQKK